MKTFRMRKAGNFLLAVLAIFSSTIHCRAGEKDLRPLFEKYGIGIYDQGDRGTCSVFAVTGLLEFEYARKQGKAIPLSVEFLNWASNQITGEMEDGSYFSDAVMALKKYGVCSDELFPYYIRNYSRKAEPSKSAIKEARQRRDARLIWIKEWDPETGMSDEQIMEVKKQIINEHPVAIGFQWPKKDTLYRKTENGIMTIPPREGVFDGHSVIIVGFRDTSDVPGGGYFIFKNSHGMQFGENGFGKMPYAYAGKYANDGVSIHLKN